VSVHRRCVENPLASQLTQEILFAHTVFEGFSSVDEHNRDFVIELATQFEVRIDIDFPPRKASPARELGETLFHDLAEVTTLAGVDDDVARFWHARRILARRNGCFPVKTGIP